MKKHVKLALMGMIVFASCKEQTQTPECPPTALTEQFLSTITLRGEGAVTYIEGSFEGITNQVFKPALRKGLDSTMRLGDPLRSYMDEDKIWLTRAEIKRTMIWVDTIYVESATPPHNITMQVVHDTIGADLFHSIRAYEQWFIDDSLKLKRVVKSYIPVAENIDRTTGLIRGLQPLFYVESDKQNDELKKVASVQYRQTVKSTDWFDWYIDNLEASVREKFFTPLMKKAWNGSIPVYASPNSQEMMSSDDLKNRLCRVDTAYFESPDPPYDIEMYVTEECYDNFQDQIVALDFIQDVYVDKNMALSFDVKWYAPLVEVSDPVLGEPTGKEQILFWVKN